MEKGKNGNKNLNWYLVEARKNSQAIGHFNFATEDVLRGIVEASKEAGAPAVMVGTSEGEAGFVGMKEAAALVKAMRDDFNYPVFLNADHFKSFEKCKEAVDAGYESIIIDASKLPNEENIALTKRVVDYCRSVSPDISVEGELGYLRGSSEVQTKIEINPADYSKPEEVADFVSRTGVDRMAVVFGNIHGIVTDQEEKLDIEHFSKIVSYVEGAPSHSAVYYVLHGASGLKDENIIAAIKAGITNVHFNTELRVAYRNEIDKQFHAHPNETTPYKYLGPAVDEVKKLVTQKIKLFIGR